MQLQQLRYFVAVAQLRHFTQAADRIGVAQPSLSKQIHSLEADLGTPLFARGRRGVTLTQAGQTLLPLATRIVADVDAARHAVAQVIGVHRGRVRLGATPSICVSIVPPVLRRFRAAHPDVNLHLEESGSRDLERSLAEGTLDLALIVLPAVGVDPALSATPLLRESLVVASTAPFPGGAVSLGDLRDRPLVMFREGYDLREATLDACRQAGFVPRFAVEGGEMDVVLSLVEAGLGAAIVPAGVAASRPALHTTPLAPPGMHRVIALAHRHDAPLPHAAAALRSTLLAHLTDSSADDLLF